MSWSWFDDEANLTLVTVRYNQPLSFKTLIPLIFLDFEDFDFNIALISWIQYYLLSCLIRQNIHVYFRELTSWSTYFLNNASHWFFALLCLWYFFHFHLSKLCDKEMIHWNEHLTLIAKWWPTNYVLKKSSESKLWFK